MKHVLLKVAAATPMLFLTAAAASAQSYSGRWWDFWNRGGWSHGSGETRSSVPEIDASTGALAIAAVVAALLLAREIKRRRKA
ncbi:MAG: VPEID-CTERM sorting domain-containing protein [Rhodobacteraceae bacterium]|nr:VPEID-CTERM sorting domain-containing protein [Paracoccaceae bacterium]